MTKPNDEGSPAPVIAFNPLAAARRDAKVAWGQDAYAPLVTEGPLIDKLRAKLSDIAVELGHPPEVQQTVEVGTAGFHRALLDRDVTVVRIVSPGFTVPGDARRLGIAIADVQLDGKTVPLTDLRLQQGFYDIENGGTLRWTNGDAYIVLDAVPYTRVLRLRVMSARPESA